MENSSLVKELQKYCRMTKLLLKSLHDTRKTFRDINTSRCMIANHGITAEFSKAEELSVETIACQAPCVVILGQSTSICAEIANWILGCDVLPKPGSLSWRTILFRYAPHNRIGLVGDFENSKNASHEASSLSSPGKQGHLWNEVISLGDLEVGQNDNNGNQPVDVKANLPILASGARVAVVGCRNENLVESYQSCISNVVPVVIYAFMDAIINDEEMNLLRFIRKSDENLPVYFVRMPSSIGDSISDIYLNEGTSPQIYRQLREFFNDTQSNDSASVGTQAGSVEPTITRESPTAFNEKSLGITHPDFDIDKCGSTCDAEEKVRSEERTVKLVNFANVQPLHVSCSASTDNDYDNVSDQVIDQNAIEADCDSCFLNVESELVEGVFEGFCLGLSTFVRTVLQNRIVSTVALLHAVHKRCLELMISSAYDMQWDTICTPTRLKFARDKEAELYQALILVAMKKQDEVKRIILDTVSCESENILLSVVNLTLTGELSSEEDKAVENVRNVREFTTQIHEFVLAQLNAAISCKLLQLVDVLHESYTGVLTRCLASLEEKDFEGSRSTDTSDALKEILTAAYHVEISVGTGASFVKTFLEKMKQLMHGPMWRAPSSLDDAWKRKTAASVLSTLTEARCQRLAKSICAQIKERVRSSHACFQTSMQRLENHHNGRLKQTEQQSLNVRKNYAPRVARLALESQSLRDLILYGKPELGREIGRGQYGVVYTCNSWAGLGRCAVKSVAPPDERHWNDLAMEFHYTTNIPEHNRIVSLRGSIIDYTYGSGRTPAVLLIMEQYKYDLYTAIERRMNWLNRLQVAVDVVEGIRYLHAQGLVHRDIKLKNVLLDDQNRGRLTDLGFCKPEAMMSGSIVGTPLHMAPELITGRYDHSVDVYAFGVLFWYICAGSIRLPSHFEVCANKETLFTRVQQGLRPERPQDCDAECWDLMRRCWNADPAERPHVGELENSLRAIFERFLDIHQQAVANGDVIESDFITDSATTDSDIEYDDLTLK